MLAAVCALGLIASAAEIWLTRGLLSSAGGAAAEDVYTREGIAQHLAGIAPIVWAFLVSAVLSGTFSLFCREQKKYPKPQKLKTPSPAGKKATAAVRGMVLVFSAALILLGLCNGGMKDVFVKAVKICTECVGLG